MCWPQHTSYPYMAFTRSRARCYVMPSIPCAFAGAAANHNKVDDSHDALGFSISPSSAIIRPAIARSRGLLCTPPLFALAGARTCHPPCANTRQPGHCICLTPVRASSNIQPRRGKQTFRPTRLATKNTKARIHPTKPTLILKGPTWFATAHQR